MGVRRGEHLEVLERARRVLTVVPMHMTVLYPRGLAWSSFKQRVRSLGYGWRAQVSALQVRYLSHYLDLCNV